VRGGWFALFGDEAAADRIIDPAIEDLAIPAEGPKAHAVGMTWSFAIFWSKSCVESLSANRYAARMGPTVWELEGPMPILKRSKRLVCMNGVRTFSADTQNRKK
jgi:hypothetical protein